MAIQIHRGLFTHVLQLRNVTKTQDEGGGHGEEYDTWLTTRGYFRKKSGFRGFIEGDDQLVKEFETFLFWRHEIEANINIDTRMLYDNRVFKIVDKERYQEDRNLLKFTLIEVE
jgi:head-tail adaptor